MIIDLADQVSSRALTIRSFGVAFDRRSVIAKEPQHFLSRVRPSRIGVGAGGTAARPSVTGSMDAPLLYDCLPVRIGMDRAGVGMATRYLSATYFLLPVRGSHGTGDDMISVSRVYYSVTIAMENDGRDGRPVFENGRSLTERGRGS